MSEDLIKRSDAIEAAGDQSYIAYEIRKKIRMIPSADTQKCGHWIYHFDDLFPAESTQECSVCHEEEFMSICNENFCPNCGARMVKPDE